MPITVLVRKNLIPRVMASVTEKTVDAVRDNAHAMRARAQSIAPVQTGAFRASLYVNGPDNESDYGIRAADASRLNRKANIVPELRAADVDPKVNPLRNQFGRFSLPEAIVAPAVEYGLYLEEGTVYMSARPTLRPAALATEPSFKNAMSQVADGF